MPFFAASAERGYVGGNVTLPHKEAAFRAAAEPTEVARKLEAANTLWLEDGRLRCRQHRCLRLPRQSRRACARLAEGSTALVIGAGGASRAVLQALIEAGFKSIVLLNRTVARAEALARHFGGPVRAAGSRRTCAKRSPPPT